MTNNSPIHWDVAMAPGSVSRQLKCLFGKVDTNVRQIDVDTK